MFQDHKHVKDVWDPLRIDENIKNPRQQASFNNIELLKRLAECKTSSVALVKGHSGMGKTTLVKRNAHDWAIVEALLFAVPLRYGGETVLQLAADYYTKILGLALGHKIELLKCLHQLDRQLLLCFNGFDEYGS